MKKDTPDINTILSSSIVFSSKRSIPFMPGVLLIALGLVVLLAPRLILGAVAVCLLVLGALFCFVAYKVIALRNQVKAMTKNFEGSFYGPLRGAGLKSASFGDKPDIDITDFENSKKIVYH